MPEQVLAPCFAVLLCCVRVSAGPGKQGERGYGSTFNTQAVLCGVGSCLVVLRLTQYSAKGRHGNVAGMEFCGNCMLTLERNQIWQELRDKCRANHQSNSDAAACFADSV